MACGLSDRDAVVSRDPTAGLHGELSPRRRLCQPRPPGTGSGTQTSGPETDAARRGGAPLPTPHTAPGDVDRPAPGGETHRGRDPTAHPAACAVGRGG